MRCYPHPHRVPENSYSIRPPIVDSERRRRMDVVSGSREDGGGDGDGDGKRMKLSHSLNSLSERLLVEILARLPSRSAFRLKLVCKRWYSLISSNYFVTFFNHRRHDSSLPPIHDHHSPSSSLVFQFEYRLYRGTYDDCLPLVSCGNTRHGAKLCGRRRFDLGFLPHPQRKIELKASCADLILCSYKEKSKSSPKTVFYYVCNLLTRQWLALPPTRAFKRHAIGFLCVPAPCSLCDPASPCLDNSHYNFVVVQIRIASDIVPHSEYKVQLFSSVEGNWKTLVVSSPRTLLHRDKDCNSLVAYKGMLHWLTSNCVLVFDPINAPKRFSRVINLPFLQPHLRVHGFGIYQDRLRVSLGAKRLLDHGYYIWELEDYNSGEWSLAHTLHTKDLDRMISPDNFSIKKAYILHDGNLVYMSNFSTIWLCNLQNGLNDHQYELIDRSADRGGEDYLILSHHNVHQIANQWWPTPVPQLPCTS